MSLKLIKSLLLLAIAIVGFGRAVYDVRIETFTKIEGDTETLMEINLRLVGRHHLLNGTWINHVDFDDTYEFVGVVEAFVNGEWKPLALNTRLRDSNMPKGKDKCPFKKGEYYMKNVEFESDNWPLYARRGLNKFKLTIVKDNITYGGLVETLMITDRNI